jgi:hypothetical protein
MKSVTQISLSPDELEVLINQAIAPLIATIQGLENRVGMRKHAYTVTEVAILIGYSEWTVREFIKKGRKDKKGQIRLLPKREITAGDYRILPYELDAWLLYF